MYTVTKKSIWEIAVRISITKCMDDVSVEATCLISMDVDLSALMDLMTMRLRRAAIIDRHVLTSNVMLMGRMQIGSYAQKITMTEDWLAGITGWPQRLRSGESMSFCRHGVSVKEKTKDLPAFRTLLPPSKSYNTLFAIGIDLLMGATESRFAAKSYQLLIRPVTMKSGRGWNKEAARYEVIWVVTEIVPGHAEFFLQVMAIPGIAVQAPSKGTIDLASCRYQVEEAIACEERLVPTVIKIMPVDNESEKKPPVPSTPPPAKKKQQRKTSTITLPKQSVVPETGSAMSHEEPQILSNKPVALEFDVPETVPLEVAASEKTAAENLMNDGVVEMSEVDEAERTATENLKNDDVAEMPEVDEAAYMAPKVPEKPTQLDEPQVPVPKAGCLIESRLVDAKKLRVRTRPPSSALRTTYK